MGTKKGPRNLGPFLCIIRLELVGQGETLEGDDLGFRIHGLEGGGHGEFVVGELILLLHEGVLFQELLDTTVHDAHDHLLRQGGGFLRTYLGNDLAGLVGLLGGDPALGSVGLDVVLAVNVGGVDAGLLEGGVNGLLYLLVLGLLDGHGALGLQHLCGDGFGIHSHRVHGSHLHGNTTGDVIGNDLAESHDGAQFAVEVDILAHERGLEGAIVSKDVLLTGFAGLVGDVLVQGVTVCGLYSLEGLQVCGELGDSCIGDGSGEGFEIGRSSHEVGLAAQAHEDGLSAVDTAENGTLGGLIVTTLGEGGLTLLAKDFNGTLEVACGLFEGLFAIHHAGAGHIAQFLDIC